MPAVQALAAEGLTELGVRAAQRLRLVAPLLWRAFRVQGLGPMAAEGPEATEQAVALADPVAMGMRSSYFGGSDDLVPTECSP